MTLKEPRNRQAENARYRTKKAAMGYKIASFLVPSLAVPEIRDFIEYKKTEYARKRSTGDVIA